ncbi:MAG: RcpC/CpaB family pilus assembly protein [Acidimicrobiales bacterium]
MNRKVLGLIGAGLLGFFGLVLLGGYLVGGSGGKKDEKATVPVLVLDEAATKGSLAQGLAARTEQRPVDEVPADRLPSLADVAGKMTAAALDKGAVLTTAHFVAAESFSRVATPVEVPKDLLTMSFSVEPQRALGGQLRAGDKVAIFATFTDMQLKTLDKLFGRPSPEGAESITVSMSGVLLHKVLVANVAAEQVVKTDVKTNPQDVSQAPTAPFTVTVAVNAKQAEELAYALEFGKIWLAAEPDEAVEDGTGVRSHPLGLDPLTSQIFLVSPAPASQGAGYRK